MSDAASKQMIENSSPSVPTPPEPRRQPPGTVERILNMRERNYVVGVCLEFLKKNPGHKTQIKVARVKELVGLDETREYIDMIDESYDEKRSEWRRAKNQWQIFRTFQEGSLSLEDFRKACPDVDPLRNPPQKPAWRQPEATPLELRGPEHPFFFPSKLDAFVQDCLKASGWDGVLSEYVAELCGKFNITDE